MIRTIQILLLIFALFSLTNCKKDTFDPTKQPYSTGHIQFLYYNYITKPVLNLTVPTSYDGIYNVKDKILSIQREASSIRSDFAVTDRVTIRFLNFDLDKIHVPFTLGSDGAYANFWFENIYATNTEQSSGEAPGSMTMTIISKKNDRIQGIFSGVLFRNSNGNLPVYMREGKFDIKVKRE
jgi:hypothetical protein